MLAGLPVRGNRRSGALTLRTHADPSIAACCRVREGAWTKWRGRMAITDNVRPRGMLVDGEPLHSGRTRTILDPSTGTPLAEVAEGGAADAERRARARVEDRARTTAVQRLAVHEHTPRTRSAEH